MPHELDEVLGRSFELLMRLFRCPFHLASHPRLRADLADRLKALAGSGQRGIFLSGEEAAAIAEAGRDLGKLYDVLCESNPKAVALSSLRASRPELVVVCGDTELLDGGDAVGVRSISSALDLADGCCEVGHAVAGWFGRGTMNRLLRPPFAAPLYLLLYGPESNWEGAFTRHVRLGSAARRGATERGRLFPSLGKWPSRHAEDPVEVNDGAQAA